MKLLCKDRRGQVSMDKERQLSPLLIKGLLMEQAGSHSEPLLLQELLKFQIIGMEDCKFIENKSGKNANLIDNNIILSTMLGNLKITH